MFSDKNWTAILYISYLIRWKQFQKKSKHRALMLD